MTDLSPSHSAHLTTYKLSRTCLSRSSTCSLELSEKSVRSLSPPLEGAVGYFLLGQNPTAINSCDSEGPQAHSFIHVVMQRTAERVFWPCQLGLGQVPMVAPSIRCGARFGSRAWVPGHTMYPYPQFPHGHLLAFSLPGLRWGCGSTLLHVIPPLADCSHCPWIHEVVDSLVVTDTHK
jgi:hypothetical protein